MSVTLPSYTNTTHSSERERTQEDKIAEKVEKRKNQSNLRILRRRNGLTLEDLSALSGISPSYISRIEVGARRLNEDLLEKLSPVLGCQPGDLLNSSTLPNIRLVGSTENVGNNSAILQKDFPIYNGRGSFNAAKRNNIFTPIDFETPADWTFRPPQLMGMKTSFGLYVSDEDNAPKYMPGDILFVHPTRPISQGCSVVIISKNDGIAVQKFQGWQDEKLMISSFSSQNKTTLAKDELKAVYRIIGTLEFN